MFEIIFLTKSLQTRDRQELAQVLMDVVNGGASLGFIPPLTMEEADLYWHDVLAEVSEHRRLLLAIKVDGVLVGTVQLEFEKKANALHRAEVQKLMVLSSIQRRGIGRKLMQALEEMALHHQRTLLVLDTREGDAAERLYQRLGYHRVGVIPRYARSADGELKGTVFFYKELS